MAVIDNTPFPPSGGPLSSSLSWETLDALLGGVSSIDLNEGLNLRSREEAEAFIRHYGFDVSLVDDREELATYYREAVRFIEAHLLQPAEEWLAQGEPASPRLTVPPHVVASGDVTDLLLLASNGQRAPDCFWACAVLKVMHTLAHIHHAPFYKSFDQGREQILARLSAILHAEPETGGFILGEPSKGVSLRLYGFETKSRKSLESTLVKLLCKKGNVAEQVDDLIGIRLITETPAEAILVVELLRRLKIIVYPNLIPNRTRNTLIDLDAFRRLYDTLDIAHCSWEEALSKVRALQDLSPPEDRTFNEHNPSSSRQYRSLHLTCRQLVRVTFPRSEVVHRFFFPYEIQIMDRANYLESRNGNSSHVQYKRRQLAVARRRVLGPLLVPVAGRALQEKETFALEVPCPFAEESTAAGEVTAITLVAPEVSQPEPLHPKQKAQS
jgi:uncharacterized protein (TIGR04562 family)